MNSAKAIDIHAPSRLHFGLFSFGDPASPHQFGGVGAMIRSPGIHLRVSEADEFFAAGKHADRVCRFTDAIVERNGWQSLPTCKIEVVSAPRQHVGLGVGTQLGMAVAAALMTWKGQTPLDAQRLASAAGRGRRSSIGAHGFVHGGLIVDSGHSASEKLGSVEARCNLPSAWRFVLAIDTCEEGLAQKAERAAFAKLPPVPKETTNQLRTLALDELLPAAQAADYNRFANTLYDYGRLAGKCFSAVQGGPYASAAIAKRVELIRSLGILGCGQSSWGPTVFAVTPSEAAAKELVDELARADEAKGCELLIAEAANEGAEISSTT